METDQNGQKPMATGSGTSSGVSEPAAAMINYYGADGEAFIRLFAPNKQEYAAANIERTYFGQAPTIRCIVEGYGRKTALGFFLVQMEDINRFSNARIKLSTEQQSMLTAIFINQYGFLKASEFLLFFFRIKMGNYGVFAYAMEPTFFTNAMRQFMEERGKEYGEIRIELLARQREEEEKLRQQFLKQQYSRIKESTKNEDTEK